jgi:hypothetical protein
MTEQLQGLITLMAVLGAVAYLVLRQRGKSCGNAGCACPGKGKEKSLLKDGARSQL